jgi:hypothetical protein
MPMDMVHVRHVRVRVPHSAMLVSMRVGLARWVHGDRIVERNGWIVAKPVPRREQANA